MEVPILIKKKSKKIYLITLHDALTLRALTLRFLRNFRKLIAKNTTKLGNLA